MPARGRCPVAERFEALKQAHAGGRELDFWGLKQPRCPHCGAEIDVGANDLWRIFDEGEHSIDCPHCSEEFDVSTRVSYTFSSDSLPEEAAPGVQGPKA